jgi:hypothetical protein
LLLGRQRQGWSWTACSWWGCIRYVRDKRGGKKNKWTSSYWVWDLLWKFKDLMTNFLELAGIFQVFFGTFQEFIV